MAEMTPALIEQRRQAGLASAAARRKRLDGDSLTWDDELKSLGTDVAAWARKLERERNFDPIGWYQDIIAGAVDIKQKDAAGIGMVGIAPMKPRKWQRQLSRELIDWRRTKTTRWMELVLKYRQAGYTTYWDAFLWRDISRNRGAGAAVSAHTNETLMALQRNFRVFAKQDKGEGLAKRMGDKLFESPNGSYVRLCGATDALIRGDSPRHLHVSEADYVVGLEEALQSAVPAIERTSFATVCLESTIRRGMGTEFKDFVERVHKGQTDYRIRFLEWHKDETCYVQFTDEQAKDFMASIDSANNPAREYEQMLRDKWKLSAGQIAFWRNVLRQDAAGNLQAAIEIMPVSLEEALEFTKGAEFLYTESLDWIRNMCRDPGSRMKMSVTGMVELDDPRDWRAQPHMLAWTRPEWGQQYVIGADIADEGERSVGEDGSENYAVVANVENGEVVAEWHGYATAPEFANVLHGMARWYNDALVVPEANRGLGVIRHLSDNLQYSNIYRRESFTSDAVMQGEAFGFYTTAQTRPILVERVQDVVNNRKMLIRSKKMHEQLVGFADRRGRPQKKQAVGKVADDGCIALALATFGHDGLSSGRWRAWSIKESPRPIPQMLQHRPRNVIFDDEEDDGRDLNRQRGALGRT